MRTKELEVVLMAALNLQEYERKILIAVLVSSMLNPDAAEEANRLIKEWAE